MLPFFYYFLSLPLVIPGLRFYRKKKFLCCHQVEIYSRCYQSSPLVIQGAGAGNDTTAAGVLADIIDLQDLFQTMAWSLIGIHTSTPSWFLQGTRAFDTLIGASGIPHCPLVGFAPCHVCILFTGMLSGWEPETSDIRNVILSRRVGDFFTVYIKELCFSEIMSRSPH